MRTTKFRQKIFNGWHYWGFIEIEGHLIFKGIVTGHFFTIEEALRNSQQFTGLHDKNGKEIWEGDIVKFSVRSKTYIKTIGWAEKLARFWIIGEFDRLEDPIHWKIEVIGNIYESPELLEGDPISKEYRSTHLQGKFPGKSLGD